MAKRDEWPEAPRLTVDGPAWLPKDADYMVELAKAGNVQAAEMLIGWSADKLGAGGKLPRSVAFWLANGLRGAAADPNKAGVALGIAKGKGAPAKRKATIRGGLEHSVVRDIVGSLNRDGAPLRDRTARDDELGPAFIGAFEVARELGIETEPRAIRDAYYPRKPRKRRGSDKSG